MKTLDEIRKRAAEMEAPMVEFYRRQLSGFGDITDELRVVGYLGELMMRLAERELTAIKLQMDAEAKSRLIIASN